MTAAQSKNRTGETVSRLASLRWLWASTVAALALTGVVLWPELPAWRLGGTVAFAIAPMKLRLDASLCPPTGSVVELRGDSLVAGSHMGGSGTGTALAYGEVLQRELGNGISVIRRGVGGFTAQKAERYWLQIPPEGDIVILAFGTNDAAPRGWMATRHPVPVGQFKASLRRQLESLRAKGVTVALMAPPPAGSTAMNRRISPYREAVGEVAREADTLAFDPAQAVAECQPQQPLLTYDALHLNEAGHECVGKWLTKALCGE